ncbi:MAG TPA: 2-amino-4-hydroxy-6-hydroxymethyldihydropteridine diphosphokinase [Gemmataceae bacterium]|nr:2-amino-4-hydroxy-6-hydroxymethyldihydropteridine diphosphokinase [Gemmataceae bacterium]
MSAIAYIALGSNLGHRQEFLCRALQLLREQPGMEVSQVSASYETEPVGGPPGQGPYLNAAAELRTDLRPRELLQLLLDIEQKLGRIRLQHFGPRTLDLDLLLYDNLVHNEEDLIIPHPRMHERMFVLQPLLEIAPNVVHPVLGRSVLELHNACAAGAAAAPPAHVAHASAPASSEAHGEPLAGKILAPGRELGGLRALVTGSTSGIGRAIALELAAAGADVIVHGRREDAASAVAAQVRAAGVPAHVLCADLRDIDACRQLVQSAWAQWGRLDIWVNNAGADTLTGAAAQWSFARKWQELQAIDVTATMLMSREVGALMKEAGNGVILNMGWDQADTGMEGDSGQLFAAAKGAVMAFTRSLALSLSPEVRVNCLAPGWIRTAWGESASEAWQERVRRETPLQRWGTPADVARCARWLVAPAASYITGQEIRINGGAVRG